MLSLGIGLTLVLSYLLLKTQNVKRQLLNEVTHLAALFRSKNEFEIQITEQEVTLSSHVFYQKVSWELFQSYSVHGNSLLLNMGKQPFYGISIANDCFRKKTFKRSNDLLLKNLIKPD